MVLLDAAFPGELALERFGPAEDPFVNLDWIEEGPEHLDQYDVRIDDYVAGYSPGVVVKVKSPHSWRRRSRSASRRRSRR